MLYFSVQAIPDVKYGKRIHVLPIDDTVEGLTGYVSISSYKQNFTRSLVSHSYIEGLWILRFLKVGFWLLRYHVSIFVFKTCSMF